MKKSPKYSKSFKDLGIGMLLAELLPLIGLTYIKESIVTNDFAYGYSIYQAYFLYSIGFLYLLFSPIMFFLDYKNLIKQQLTIPSPWKKTFVLVFPIVTLVLSVLIFLYYE